MSIYELIESLVLASQPLDGCELMFGIKRFRGVIYLNINSVSGKRFVTVPLRLMPQEWDGEADNLRRQIGCARAILSLELKKIKS